MGVPPCDALVLGKVRNGPINISYSCNYLKAFFKRDDRRAPLHGYQGSVCRDSGNQILAVPSCGFQNIEMSDMKKVVASGNVTDAHIWSSCELVMSREKISGRLPHTRRRGYVGSLGTLVLT